MSRSDQRNEEQTTLLEGLARMPCWTSVRSACQGQSCQVVGGTVRDLLLSKLPADLDLTVERDGPEIAQLIASRVGARPIPIGRDRFASFRIVGSAGTVDIWDRQGGSLDLDLQRRDFTVNSIAIDIATGQLTDPFQGLDDLRHRLWRATTDSSFEGDPLRVLRLCRFVAQLEESTIDPETARLARAASDRLGGVAAERIATELEVLLGLPKPWPGIEAMISLEVYPQIFGLRSRTDPLARADLTRRLRDLLIRSEEVAELLSAPADGDLCRLAIVLDQIPDTEVTDGFDWLEESRVARQLRTRKERRWLSQLLTLGGMPRHLDQQRWFLYQHKQRWSTAILILATLRSSDCRSDERFDLVRQISDQASLLGDRAFAYQDLVSGDDLVHSLALEPGVVLGAVLAKVQRAQIEGRIKTREQAIDLARDLVAGRDE